MNVNKYSISVKPLIYNRDFSLCYLDSDIKLETAQNIHYKINIKKMFISKIILKLYLKISFLYLLLSFTVC